MDLYGALATDLTGAHPDLNVPGLTSTIHKLPGVRLEAADWTYPEQGDTTALATVTVAVMVAPEGDNLQTLDEQYAPAVFQALKAAGHDLARNIGFRSQMQSDGAASPAHYARLFRVQSIPITLT